MREKKETSSQKTKRMVGLALLTAIVVVLQIIATFIKVGSFSITLTLIPIVVGTAIYGPRAGAYLGGVFGVVVVIACILGWDPYGFILWSAKPFTTILLCLFKGIAAGYVAGLLFNAIYKKHLYGGVIIAAIASPIVNTGIFIAGMALFYNEILVEWAAGSSVVYFAIIGLTGLNFVLEFGLNVVLSPVVARIINIEKKAA